MPEYQLLSEPPVHCHQQKEASWRKSWWLVSWIKNVKVLRPCSTGWKIRLPRPLKAFSSIADKNKEKNICAKMHPCFNPLANGPVYSVDWIFTFILMRKALMMLVNFLEDLYFQWSCHNPYLPTVSNVLVKFTNSTYGNYSSCSTHFSWIWHRQNVHCAPIFPKTPLCISKDLRCNVLLQRV